MAAPFPGMDPYIEQAALWLDFHNNLAVEVQGQLNALIQPKYFAGLGSYVTYDVIDVELSLPLGHRAVRPDVDVWRTGMPGGPPGPGVAVITPAPAEAVVPLDAPLELLSVEVRATAGRELVTAVEILSPVNKRPGHPARGDYLGKRADLLRSPAHLLEIDLLRGGERPPLLTPVPQAPYYVILSRAPTRPAVEVWPIQIADPLPVLPVPLRPPDADVPLDLGAAVAAVYARGGFATRIDYTQAPPAPLVSEEVVWMDARLRAQGRR